MRLVRVNAPEDQAAAVAQLAYTVGIDAAVAQIAVVPAWFGLIMSAGDDEPSALLIKRALTLLMNLSAIFMASFVTCVALRFRPAGSHDASPTNA